jgi:hypothetical protein
MDESIRPLTSIERTSHPDIVAHVTESPNRVSITDIRSRPVIGRSQDKPRVRFLTKPWNGFTPMLGGEWLVTSVQPKYGPTKEYDAWVQALLWMVEENARLAARRSRLYRPGVRGPSKSFAGTIIKTHQYHQKGKE